MVDRISCFLGALILVLMLLLATAPELTALQRVSVVVLSPLVLVLHVMQPRAERYLARRKRARR